MIISSLLALTDTMLQVLLLSKHESQTVQFIEKILHLSDYQTGES